MTTDHVGFVVKKGSEFKGLFNYNLLKLRTSGLLHFLELKWFQARRPQSLRVNSEDSSALGYDNLFFPSAALVLGAALALLLAASERAAVLGIRRKIIHAIFPKLH